MAVVRPLVVMAHGEPRFFCSCGQSMTATHGRRLGLDGEEGDYGRITISEEYLWYACEDCGSITQEIEVGAVATAESVS